MALIQSLLLWALVFPCARKAAPSIKSTQRIVARKQEAISLLMALTMGTGIPIIYMGCDPIQAQSLKLLAGKRGGGRSVMVRMVMMRMVMVMMMRRRRVCL